METRKAHVTQCGNYIMDCAHQTLRTIIPMRTDNVHFLPPGRDRRNYTGGMNGRDMAFLWPLLSPRMIVEYLQQFRGLEFVDRKTNNGRHTNLGLATIGRSHLKERSMTNNLSHEVPYGLYIRPQGAWSLAGPRPVQCLEYSMLAIICR